MANSKKHRQLSLIRLLLHAWTHRCPWLTTAVVPDRRVRHPSQCHVLTHNATCDTWRMKELLSKKMFERERHCVWQNRSSWGSRVGSLWRHSEHNMFPSPKLKPVSAAHLALVKHAGPRRVKEEAYGEWGRAETFLLSPPEIWACWL